MDIPHHAHVLVIDGHKSLLFRNEGGVAEPNLTLTTLDEQPSVATRDQGTERPGRAHASVGAGRSGYDQTDFHQLDEDRFARGAADMLRREVLEGHIETLIVVAAPRTLGEMRKHYHTEVRKRLVGEISREFVGRPTEEIAMLVARS